VLQRQPAAKPRTANDNINSSSEKIAKISNNTPESMTSMHIHR